MIAFQIFQNSLSVGNVAKSFSLNNTSNPKNDKILTPPSSSNPPQKKNKTTSPPPQKNIFEKGEVSEAQ